GQRISAPELRHLNDLTTVGIGQAKKVAVTNEGLDAVHRRARVLQKLLRLAVLLTYSGGHPLNRGAPALAVVRRQRRMGEILAPKLAGDDIHVALDAGEIGLGVRQ